jgi:hypothetical protein
MSEEETKMSPAAIAQIEGNLRLATKFIRELLDRPEDSEPIPLGATVVLLPPEGEGGSELRRANLAMAQRLQDEGRPVVFWTVSEANGIEQDDLSAVQHWELEG